MGPGLNGNGIAIRRHDLGKFRQQVAGPAGAAQAAPAPGDAVPPPAGIQP